jgi:multicomponent Na+:H+ antiporter subunit E
MDKGENILSGPSAVVRLLVFLGVWFVLYGPDMAALPVGVGAAAAAAWTSFRLLPSGAFRPRPGSLIILALRFLWESVVAGIDVARRALEPRLPLRPGFVAYPIRMRPSPARSAFLSMASLLPGTLPTGLDETGTLVVHCLDTEQPVVAQMAAEEALLIRALGVEL